MICWFSEHPFLRIFASKSNLKKFNYGKQLVQFWFLGFSDLHTCTVLGYIVIFLVLEVKPIEASGQLCTLSKLSKTTSPNKLFANDCVTLYQKNTGMFNWSPCISGWGGLNAETQSSDPNPSLLPFSISLGNSFNFLIHKLRKVGLRWCCWGIVGLFLKASSVTIEPHLASGSI